MILSTKKRNLSRKFKILSFQDSNEMKDKLSAWLRDAQGEREVMDIQYRTSLLDNNLSYHHIMIFYGEHAND